MLGFLGQGAFAVGYAVYKTRVGHALHQRTCAECTKPHSLLVSVQLVPNVHVVVVPMLHDNYAFLIVDESSRCCLAVDPAGKPSVLVVSNLLHHSLHRGLFLANNIWILFPP